MLKFHQSILIPHIFLAYSLYHDPIFYQDGNAKDIGLFSFFYKYLDDINTL